MSKNFLLLFWKLNLLQRIIIPLILMYKCQYITFKVNKKWSKLKLHRVGGRFIVYVSAKLQFGKSLYEIIKWFPNASFFLFSKILTRQKNSIITIPFIQIFLIIIIDGSMFMLIVWGSHVDHSMSYFSL